MTKKEFALFASALRTYYPKENILPNEQAMILWFKQLEDIPYDLAEVALNKWVTLNKWSPSIAEIREQAAGIITGNDKSWGEAWEEVLKAISKYGSYNANDALNSLDETTRRVVKQIGYNNLCMSEDVTRDRASFRMIYEIEAQKQKQRDQMPARLKALIQNMPAMIEGVQDEEK